jgi:hypothetical protein
MGWQIARRQGALLVVFDGHLTAEEGPRSIADFTRVLGHGTSDVIWDITRMRGYDSAARDAWQHGLASRRAQIRSITVVGGGALVRLGASTIGLLLGIRCRFVRQLAEIGKL